MDMFGYILCSFRDSCPGFISFRQNTPCVGSRRGTAQGAALLTKWGETAIIKTERALLLVVGSSYQLIIIYADRLAPPRRSARFYRTERAPLLAVGSTRFAQIDYADRSVAAERSARFYGQVCKTPCVGSRSGTAQGMQRS